MTIAEAHNEFRQAGDRLDSSNIPDMLVEQVDYFLNEASVRFVKTRYSGNNESRMSFEENQKRTEDTKTLVITEFPTVSSVLTETNVFQGNLSSLYVDEAFTTISTKQYWFFVRCRARVVSSGCTSTYNKVLLYQHDDLDDILEDPFKKPSLNELVGYFESSNLYVVCPSNVTIDKIKLTYIKKPITVIYGTQYPTPTLDVNFDLPEHTHKEIIQLAVVIALENIESKRLETVMGLKQTIE